MSSELTTRPVQRAMQRRAESTVPPGRDAPEARFLPSGRNVRLAGLSALAEDTRLAEPAWRTIAVTPDAWETLRGANVTLADGRTPGLCECQVWHYSPALLANSRHVDPLSLTVSLREDPDERVQQAIAELRGRLPW